MTSPTITDAMRNAFYEATTITRKGTILDFDKGLAAVLSLFPEGRSEQIAWTCADALMFWLNEREEISVPKSEVYAWAMAYRPPNTPDRADIAAAWLRIKALEEGLKPFADAWNHGIKCSDLRIHDLAHRRSQALTVVKVKHLQRAARLSSAQGETKPVDCGTAYGDPGFPIVGLPESPSGERDEPGAGATAALAVNPEGCGKCVYCLDIGAPELCRGYDAAALVEGE